MAIKIYAKVLEQKALAQFNDAISQPFVTNAALMPDAHAGYSLPIGAVVETNGYIIPAWVGYDIGCGMCALKLGGIAKEAVEQYAKEIFDEIYETIPVGFNINKESTKHHSGYVGLTEHGEKIAEAKNWQRALGSLGGGNHFIEIGYDTEDNVWVVIHSGSRGVGHAIAAHYMKKAHPGGKAKEGHFGFDILSDDGKDYIDDMNWCLQFALDNRLEMMHRVINAITLALDISCYEIDLSSLINKNHNHAEVIGNKVIHRKGATQAGLNMYGVIPGNMKDGSFIVLGKGNKDSLNSSSHGAGRVLGRRKAKETLSFDDFKDDMEGITALVDTSTLDESRFAYKNIFEVMELQKDLVEVVTHIKPLINIKG